MRKHLESKLAESTREGQECGDLPPAGTGYAYFRASQSELRLSHCMSRYRSKSTMTFGRFSSRESIFRIRRTSRRLPIRRGNSSRLHERSRHRQLMRSTAVELGFNGTWHKVGGVRSGDGRLAIRRFPQFIELQVSQKKTNSFGNFTMPPRRS
jgi:hypothetical protein